VWEAAAVIDLIVSAATVLDEVVKFGGYTKYAVQEIRKLLREAGIATHTGIFGGQGLAKTFAKRHESEVSQALGPQAAFSLLTHAGTNGRSRGRFTEAGLLRTQSRWVPILRFRKGRGWKRLHIHVRSFYGSDWARWVFFGRRHSALCQVKLSEKDRLD
jgi:hypothetical protein